MDRLEQELRNALRRQEPAGDFTARVMARVAQEPERGWWSRCFALPRLRWATAVALCIVILAGVLLYRGEQARKRAEGEAAKQQVMLALRIAGSKLQLAQAKVQRLSER
jgi:negative regulator of sigma E activity